MKKKKIFRIMLFVFNLLFVSLTLYAVFWSDDSYQFYTGMGNTVELSPDDEQLIFPFYINGAEAIYQADVDGSNVLRLTTPDEGERQHHPKLSASGEKLLYISDHLDQASYVVIADRNGDDEQRVTSNEFHVSEAIFSQDEQSIYFAATPAEEFNKGLEGNTVGYDLYRIGLNGGEPKRLTTGNYYSLDVLTLAASGEALYFYEDAIMYVLMFNKMTVSKAFDAKVMPKSGYHFQLSPDETKLLYSTISKESENSSLFEYELFAGDLKTGKQSRLTDLNAAVVSPRFFHNQSDQVLFLLNDNWPNSPEEHLLYTQSLTSKKLSKIQLDVPEATAGQKFKSQVYSLLNGYTLAGFYTLLGGLFTTYMWFYRPTKLFLPSIISFLLSALMLVASFVCAFAYDPWAGIALGMVAATMAGASVIIVIYAWVLRFFKRQAPVKH